MKKDIGFIALGQAGGNVGKLLEEQDYNVVYVNSATEDLDTLTTNKKYHIKNGEGCNKNRTKAKMLIKEDISNIYKYINENLKEEYVYVIASSGGGTGSGALPVISNVLCSNKKVGVITILPSEDESVQSHINTYECFQELAKIENLGSIFIIDNNKNTSIIDVNTKFVNLFNSLLNVRNNNGVNGNIDKAEIKEILQSKGCVVINKQNRKHKQENKSIVEVFNENNVFSDIEDDKVIKYALYSGKRLDKKALTTTFGVPKDIYTNVNDKNDLLVLSGLTIPIKRLFEIKENVSKNRDTIIKNINSIDTMFSKLEGDSIGFDIDKKEKVTAIKEIDTSTFDDLFDKFI